MILGFYCNKIMERYLYKILLINLEKDKDRLKYMSDQLSKQSLLFERLEAVNGKEYMDKDGSEYDERSAKRWGGGL